MKTHCPRPSNRECLKNKTKWERVMHDIDYPQFLVSSSCNTNHTRKTKRKKKNQAKRGSVFTGSDSSYPRFFLSSRKKSTNSSEWIEDGAEWWRLTSSKWIGSCIPSKMRNERTPFLIIDELPIMSKSNAVGGSLELSKSPFIQSRPSPYPSSQELRHPTFNRRKKGCEK